MIKSMQVELQIDSRLGSSEKVTDVLGLAPDERYESPGKGSRVVLAIRISL